MKKAIILSVLGAALSVGAGSGAAYLSAGKEVGSPQSVAKAYYEALQNKDYETAYRYCMLPEDGSLTLEEFTQEYEASDLAQKKAKTLGLGQVYQNDTDQECRDVFLNGEEDASFVLVNAGDRVLGLFDSWRVENIAPTIKNFAVTVLPGATVSVNGQTSESLDAEKTVSADADVYLFHDIPEGECTVTVKHPIFQTVTETIDSSTAALDMTDKKELKENNKILLTNDGKQVVQLLYSGALTTDKSWSSSALLTPVKTQATDAVNALKATLDSSKNRQVNAIYFEHFAEEIGDVSFSKDGTQIFVEMILSCDYWYWVENGGTRAKVDGTTSFQYNFTYQDGEFTLNEMIPSNVFQTMAADTADTLGEQETEASSEGETTSEAAETETMEIETTQAETTEMETTASEV